MKTSFSIVIIVIIFFTSAGYSQINKDTQSQFDSDSCCWRLLSASRNYKDAAELIVKYLNTNPNHKNKHSLNWHAGQMFALSNNYKFAKRYFKKTYSIFYKIFSDEDGKMWYYYAKGTVAYINRNKNRLKKILEYWRNTYPYTKNYYALKKLYDYWDLPYENASH